MTTNLVRLGAGALALAGSLVVLAGCSNSSSTTPTPNPTANCGTPAKNSRVYITNASGSVSSNVNSPDTIDSLLISSLLNAQGSQIGVCQQINSQAFSSAYGIAVDSGANIWVVDQNSSTIMKFSPTANGTVNPTQTITASALTRPFGIAIDGAGNLWVTVPGGSSSSGAGGEILEFSNTRSGNVAPTRIIAGSKTLLSGPTGIAVTGGKVYVTNEFGNSVEVFSTGDHGNVSPTRVISGAGSGLNTPLAVVVNSIGLIFVANNGGNSITVYGAGTTPRRTIAGSNTGLNGPAGLAFDASGNLYVGENGPLSSNPSNPTGELEIFAPAANGNVNPIVNVSGVGFSAWGVAVF